MLADPRAADRSERRRLVVRCADVATALPDDHSTDLCCDSCHEEQDYGYADMPEAYPSDKQGWVDLWADSRILAVICCRVKTDEWTRETWARLARAARSRVRQGSDQDE